jgi:hypothetical protein
MAEALLDISLIFSPDGRFIANAAERDGKWFAVVDGQAFPAPDEAWPSAEKTKGTGFMPQDYQESFNDYERRNFLIYGTLRNSNACLTPRK